MRLEQMREEFPKMPDEMRAMIESEVARQMKIERPFFGADKSGSGNDFMEGSDSSLKYNAGRRSVGRRGAGKMCGRRMSAILAAAAMVLGTTVFAGAKIYQIYSEKEGNYGLKIGIGAAEGVDGGESPDVIVPEEIPEVQIEMNYIPEGMITPEGESGRMFREDTPQMGGISMAMIIMDQSDAAGSLLLDKNVTYSEQLSISDHQAVYLEKGMKEQEELGFGRVFYVVYPEVWHVLEVFVGDDMTKEEAIKVIENTELVPTGETLDLSNLYTWSDYVEQQKETEIYDYKWTATAEELKNTHTVGETFELKNSRADIEGEEFVSVDCITAKVADVQIADDLSLLGDSEYVRDEWKEAVGADGKLVSNVIRHIRQGDGIDTLDEITSTEEVAQKLVYVTVEYTNTGDMELRNVGFLGIFTGIREDGSIFERLGQYVEGKVSYTSVGRLGEMDFYDVHGGERNNNHIPVMKPGETVTVHMARIVNEDELDYLYLNLDIGGGEFEFTEGGLEQGYVDIRQKN